MRSLDSFVYPWRERLSDPNDPDPHALPGYHNDAEINSLITTSSPQSFEVGTGASIYTNSLLPAILGAQDEVILVTCFWAPSCTLTALHDTLEQLARGRARLLQEHGPEADIAQRPLRVRICFSSRSLLQKLLHTTSLDGYVYPPEKWQSQLGLPHPDVLRAGAIDLQVKSLFFLPFSVMHPKFLIVDRRTAWLPSCNISWEPWLEGCIEITGNAVYGLLAFYRDTWDRTMDLSVDRPGASHRRLDSRYPAFPRSSTARITEATSIQSLARRFVMLDGKAAPTILLPSSHHQNPKFRPWPWSTNPVPPNTPLNRAMIQLLAMAGTSIYMQTPNVTSATVIDGILEALQRGVQVNIVTSKNMMLFEQIVTAGTTTAICLGFLIRRYNKLSRNTTESRPQGSASSSNPMVDLEAGLRKPGRLRISYFRPERSHQQQESVEEPVQSHLKLTIIDGQYTVLGSGNMDRASWFTSQELGIMFDSADFAKVVKETVSEVLQTRTTTVFDSLQPE